VPRTKRTAAHPTAAAVAVPSLYARTTLIAFPSSTGGSTIATFIKTPAIDPITRSPAT